MSKKTEIEMSKDVGTCLRYKDGKQIFRSKYKNYNDANNELKRLNGLQVINPSYVVYVCPECKMFHLGLKEWEKL